MLFSVFVLSTLENYQVQKKNKKIDLPIFSKKIENYNRL